MLEVFKKSVSEILNLFGISVGDNMCQRLKVDHYRLTTHNIALLPCIMVHKSYAGVFQHSLSENNVDCTTTSCL